MFIVLCVFAACKKDWSTPERIDITGVGFGLNPQTTKDEAYYEALRAYKKSDHAIAFGWYGNWTGVGAGLENCLAGLPDSVDIVSIWGLNNSKLTLAQIKDKELVQKVKGTKVILTIGSQYIGNMFEKYDTLKAVNGRDSIVRTIFPKQDSADVVKYANMLIDYLNEYSFDGLDIDHEPAFGHNGPLADNPKFLEIFINTLSKGLGPKSGTGKLLAVDGQPASIAPYQGPLLDYFISQSYGSQSDDNLDRDDWRLLPTIQNFTGVLTPEEVAKKFIVTENFEDFALSGGVNYTDRNGNKMMSLEGMARWNPIINGKKVRKGGVGTYHMEYEYTVSGQPGTYPFLRKAMHIMNPPVR